MARMSKKASEELKQRDADLKDRAEKAKDDAEFMAKVAELAARVDPESNFARYSESNKILFLLQCADYGITPTGHTKTMRGWRAAGRKISGKSIRIIMPRTKDEETLAAEREHAKKTGSAEPSEFAGAYMGSVWDRAQTVALDDQEESAA